MNKFIFFILFFFIIVGSIGFTNDDIYFESGVLTGNILSVSSNDYFWQFKPIINIPKYSFLSSKVEQLNLNKKLLNSNLKISFKTYTDYYKIITRDYKTNFNSKNKILFYFGVTTAIINNTLQLPFIEKKQINLLKQLVKFLKNFNIIDEKNGINKYRLILSIEKLLSQSDIFDINLKQELANKINIIVNDILDSNNKNSFKSTEKPENIKSTKLKSEPSNRLKLLRKILYSDTKINPNKKLDNKIKNKTNKSLTKKIKQNPEFKNMVYIPGGTYLIGKDNIPTKIKPFYIDKYEVTNLKFKKFIDKTGYNAGSVWKKYYEKGQDYLPVVGIDFKATEAYAQWISKKLPTSEQWEAAAKTKQNFKFPWGNKWDSEKCNSLENRLNRRINVLKIKNDKNISGLTGMAGNVMEWSRTIIHSKNNDKLMHDKAIVKGGSFATPKEFCDLNKYNIQDTDSKFNFLGFRCVKEIR